MTHERPSLQETLLQLVTAQLPGLTSPVGVTGIYIGKPKLNVVVSCLTFGTELNGLRAAQHIQWLKAIAALRDVRIFVVAAGNAAALAGVDHLGKSLNRLATEYAKGCGPDYARAAELERYFRDQQIDVVLDFQESSSAPDGGMVLDVDGEGESLDRLGDILPCPLRLKGITKVQRSEYGSRTSPFATIYHAKAAVEVVLPQSSRENGAPERILTSALAGLDLLDRDRNSTPGAQHVYPVMDAYCGEPGRTYRFTMSSLREKFAQVTKGDIIALSDNGATIEARSDGRLVLGPSQNVFTAGPYEAIWQVPVEPEVRARKTWTVNL